MSGGCLRIVTTVQIETVVAAVLGHDRAAARKRLERIEPIILDPEGALPGLIVVDHAGADRPEALLPPGFRRLWIGVEC
jgi:hypothetical protein